jgi:hypothetical protein
MPVPGTEFDFQIGRWNVAHRRLKARLADCRDWEDFAGTCEMRPVLGGHGNVEDHQLHISTGSYRALAVRSFDAATERWAIWWLDDRAPHTLDAPVIGRFEDGVGAFYADEMLDGAPVRMRFLWLRTDTATPHWEQALSADGGASWETNWTMDFARA